MAKKMLLVFPKLEHHKDYHYIPLSIMAVAAPLEHYGIDYDIFDERVDHPIRLTELANDASLVAFSMFTGYQTYCGYNMIKALKTDNPELKIIVGGPHVSSLPHQTLESPLIDFIVTGYGEESLLGLARNLLSDKGQDFSSIPGVGYKKENGELVVIPQRVRFDNNYWFKLPYHRIDLEKYINPATRRVIYVSTYGCPGMCTFCATPTQRKWSVRPIEAVEKDLDYLYEKVHFREINLVEGTLFANKRRLFEMLELIRKYPNHEWIANGRASEVNGLSDEELARLPTIAGKLLHLTVGLESGSTRIVEVVMKKGKDHLQIYKNCVCRLGELGIKVVSGLIFGTPGETVEDLKDTIQYIRELREISPTFTLSSTFFRPLPGTDLYNGLDKTGWPFPRSLEEWAEVSEKTHFLYNQWMDIPWMAEAEKEEYRKIYEPFMKEIHDILI